MAFLTADDFRNLEVTSSATEIVTNQIENWLQAAKDELEVLCGSDKVKAVEDADEDAVTDSLEFRQFRKAQQLMAKAEMLLFIASRYRSGGIQVSEKDLNDSSVNSYESYSQAKKRYDDLYIKAKELVTPYLVVESFSSMGTLQIGSC